MRMVGRELVKMMDGSQAHVTFAKAVEGLPAELRGVVPEGLPYSAWQIVEHIRIAQRDILEFTRNDEGYAPLQWPEAYWPKQAAPGPGEWERSVKAVQEDRLAFQSYLETFEDDGLAEPLPWGDGQTLLREAILLVDHLGYHVGELVVLRRLLGAWG